MSNIGRHLIHLGLASGLSISAFGCAASAPGESAPEAAGETAESVISTATLQVGVTDLGYQPLSNTPRPGSALFPSPFAAGPPVLLSTVQGEPYQDTFAVSTTAVNAAGFVANTYRNDFAGYGWAAYDHLGWLGIERGVNSHIQAGTATVGTAKSVNVTFASAFSPTATMRVLVTVHGQPYRDTFTASTFGVTNTGFSANVARTDGTSGWGQNLQLDWVAWDTLADLSTFTAADGSAAIPPTYTGASSTPPSFTTLWVSFPPGKFSQPPVVLATARGHR